MPSRTLDIPPKSKLFRQVLSEISTRMKLGQHERNTKEDAWRKAEEAVLAYVPESDLDTKRRTRRESLGEQHYTTIKVPYSYALVMAAHTYITSVFLGRTPVHQYSGVHGEEEQKIQALEALMNYQIYGGEMLAPYYLWFYDSLKYGMGVLGEFWEEEEHHIAEIGPEGEIVVERHAGYKGSKLYNVQPYDFGTDPRVPVGQFQKGEFCWAKRRVSWSFLKQRERQGYYMHVDEQKEALTSARRNDEGSGQLERPSLTDHRLGQSERPAQVDIIEFYATIIPSEWGLYDSDTPVKWVFTTNEDATVLLGAQPLGSLHCQFPFAVAESEIESYGLFNRGIPEIIEPVQQTMDWLLNSHFYNVRASLNNQFIFDPSKLVVKDFQKSGPGLVIRMKPEAYGQDVRTAIHQIPVQDVTRQHMADMANMENIGERVFGINDQILGAIDSGGGRKTATEIRSATGFGVNRLKTLAEYISASAFQGHSTRLVSDAQQYYDAQQKLKIAGDLTNTAGQGFLQVTPELIAGHYQFIPVDGTLPVDKLAMATMWKELLMQMRGFPTLLARYDVGKIFTWVATLSGIKNIQQFEVQPRVEIMPDDRLMDAADKDNLIPMNGQPMSDQTRVASAVGDQLNG